MSVIEIGGIYPKCQKITNGVDVSHSFYNAGEKEIKYITFRYLAYNRVNDLVACTVSKKTESGGKLTGPIPPKYDGYVKWQSMWYNPTVAHVVISKICIQYMDNTEEEIDGKDIVNMWDEGSVYYREVVIPKRKADEERKIKEAAEAAEAQERKIKEAAEAQERKIKEAAEAQERKIKEAAEAQERKIVNEAFKKVYGKSWKRPKKKDLVAACSALFLEFKNDEKMLLKVLDKVIDEIKCSAGIGYSSIRGYIIGDYIEKEFFSNEELKKKAVTLWKEGVGQHNKEVGPGSPFFDKMGRRKMVKKYADKIRKYDSEYTEPQWPTR